MLKKIGEFESKASHEGDGPDIRIADLKAFVHDAEGGGYWAEVPMLPGCFTQAESMNELVENLNDAIQGWLESRSPEDLKALGVPYSVIVGNIGNGHRRLFRSLEFAE